MSEREITVDDRRSTDRTRMAKAASLFFGGRTGMRSCGVSVTDITNGGAGIYTQGLAVLPMTFELAFDNFRRKCRLIWRDGNFFGVAFENQNTRTDDETKVSEADGVIPAFPALSDSPQLACLGEADGWSGWPGYSRKVMAEKKVSIRPTFALPSASPSRWLCRC